METRKQGRPRRYDLGCKLVSASIPYEAYEKIREIEEMCGMPSTNSVVKRLLGEALAHVRISEKIVPVLEFDWREDTMG